MQRLLRYLVRNGLSKGLMGGNRRWLILGGVAVGWRVMRKIAGSEPIVVYSEKLEAGETVVIAHGRMPK